MSIARSVSSSSSSGITVGSFINLTNRACAAAKGSSRIPRKQWLRLIEATEPPLHQYELGLHVRTHLVVLDPELERSREPVGRLRVGIGVDGGFGGPEVVRDRPFGPDRRRCVREVDGQLLHDPLGLVCVDSLERFADTQVELGASQRAEPVVDGAANELVA